MKFIRRISFNFLTSGEIQQLTMLAERSSWAPGRQATGYVKTPVFPKEQGLEDLCTRSLMAMDLTQEQPHDCYLIRYTEGAYIPTHQDDAWPGSEHRRFNAIVVAPAEGGVLFMGDQEVAMGVGDGVYFRPDVVPHSVSMVKSGMRLVWSVGTLV